MFQSINVFEVLAIVYLIVGILLGTLGPAGKNIAKEVDSARGSPLTNAFMERDPPSELKLFLFRMTITIGFVLLWPFFIYGILKEHNRELADHKNFEDERSKGLKFFYLGGHGNLICKDCEHNEEVTSFIHGINSSTSGFQCQGCGKISSIKGGGPGKANDYEQSLECECGGALEREKVIFCPNCKSKNLSYEMQYIT
jgi:hypothetical protein